MRGLLSDVSYQWDLLAWDILSITRLVITDKIFHLVGWPDLLHSVHLGQCRGSGGSVKLAQLSILEGNEAFGYQVLSSHTRTSSNYIYPLSYPGWKIKVKCWFMYLLRYYETVNTTPWPRDQRWSTVPADAMWCRCAPPPAFHLNGTFKCWLRLVRYKS